MAFADYLYLNALFSVAWFCLVVSLLAGVFSFRRRRRRDDYFTIPLLYSVASFFAGMYLLGVALLRTEFHLGEAHIAPLVFPAALLSAVICAYLYIVLHILLGPRLPHHRLLINGLGLAALFAAMLVVLPPPLGVFRGYEMEVVGEQMVAQWNHGALPFFAVVVAMLLIGAFEVGHKIAANGYRGVWLWHGLGFTSIFVVAILDIMREFGAALAPFPLAWAGFAAFHVTTTLVLASHYSDIVESRQAYEREVQRLSEELVRDNLTGLYTRAYAESMIRAHLTKPRSAAAPGGLLFIDVDDFKQVNDRYGHRAGDQLLIALANMVRRSLRDVDVAARWGGDEFVVLVPDADRSIVRRVAARINQAVRGHPIRFGNEQARLTVSIGYTLLEFSEWSDALEAADTALFRAKAQGKDRVTA